MVFQGVTGRAVGKGEVESSIPSGSTILLRFLFQRLGSFRGLHARASLWVAEVCLAWHRPEIFRRAKDWNCLSACRRLPRHRRELSAFIAPSLMKLLSTSKSDAASAVSPDDKKKLSEKLCKAREHRARLTSETATFGCERATR